MSGAADIPNQIDPDKIAHFCHERSIRALSLFGSVLRDDFATVRSDIDVFAQFESDALRNVGLRYFSYAEDLAILGRPVDFCSQLRHMLAERVLGEAVKIYEQVCPINHTGQILGFADEVEKMNTKRSREELHSNQEFGRALERCVELVGEAATRLPQDWRDARSEIPWRQIVAMRNVMVHGYNVVLPDVLWNVATHDLPDLRIQIARIIEGDN